MADAAELEQWRSRALAAERWRDEVWAELDRRAALAREVDDVRAQLARMELSVWWRITAPPRALAALWRRLRRRLGL